MRLHVVDGTFELFRAHCSRRPSHFAPDGTDVRATVGVVQSMLALMADPLEAVTHIAVAFDNPVRSFRNDLFDGYKTEEGVDPALLRQFDPVEEAVRAIGITVWPMDRFEADDALATAAARFGGDVEQVRILTPDKDLCQCVRGQSVVTVDRIRNKVLDEGGVRAKHGVPPKAIPDLLALVGDDADGIPGLPGFGARTAAALLSRFGNIERIPSSPARWDVPVRGAERLSQTLESRRGDALLYRRLATLVTEVPLAEDLDALAWRGVPRDAFLDWCRRLGATDLAARPLRFA